MDKPFIVEMTLDGSTLNGGSLRGTRVTQGPLPSGGEGLLVEIPEQLYAVKINLRDSALPPEEPPVDLSVLEDAADQVLVPAQREPEAIEPGEIAETPRRGRPRRPEVDLTQDILCLKITPRQRGVLQKAGIYTLADLTARTTQEIRALKGISLDILYTIRWELGLMGLTLKNDRRPKETPAQREARTQKLSENKKARLATMPPLAEVQLKHICAAPSALQNLYAAGIHTVDQLCLFTAEDLFKLLRSEVSVETIKKRLGHYGLKLALK